MNNLLNIRWLFVLIFGLLFAFEIYSQPPTPTPCFTADYTRACVGQLITFNASCSNGGANIIYDFGDGKGIIQDTNHNWVIYTKPGKYSITQYGNFNSVGMQLTRTDYIEVLHLVKPAFTVKNCAGGNVEVNITETNYATYDLVVSNGSSNFSFTGLATSAQKQKQLTLSPGNYTVKVTGNNPPNCNVDSTQFITAYNIVVPPKIKVLTTDNDNQIGIDVDALLTYLKYKVEISKNGVVQSPLIPLTTYQTHQIIPVQGISQNNYCFRIIAYSDCEQDISNQVCTINLSGQALNNKNSLQWSSSSAFADYTLYKNNALLQGSSSAIAYVDDPVKCNLNYCYKIVGKLPPLSDPVIVNSNEYCLRGISNDIPATIENLTASVNEKGIELQWSKPSGMTVKEYNLSRISGAASAVIYSGIDSSLTDIVVNINQSLGCYSITYKDSCNNISEVSLKACSVFLEGEGIGKDHNKLVWTTYEGWKNGVKSYTIEKIDEDGTVYEEINLGISTQYEDLSSDATHQILRYRIKTISNDPIPFVSFSNIIQIKQNFIIALPNAFSPNGDGRNDIFEVKGSFIKNVKMWVFNSWGELIYEGSSWDGKIKSGIAQPGLYIVTLEAEDFTGEKVQRRGSITLIK